MANPQYNDNQRNETSTLLVERKVMGSLASKPGDTVLAYTPGASAQADVLCSWLNRGADEQTTALYAFVYPENGLFTVAFAQGAATRFGTSRAYTTRYVYEVTADEHARIGGLVTPLVMALPPLGSEGNDYRDGEQANQLADNRLMVGTYIPAPLTQEEEQLSQTIARCIRQNKRLFIQLGDSRNQLPVLLRAIDALPDDLRAQASLGFDVSSRCMASRALAPYLRIIAHHDDRSGWRMQAANTVMEDWRQKIFQTPVPAEILEPAESLEPSQLSQPSELSENSEPSQLSQPSEPSENSQPSEPSENSESSEPSQPSEPSEPPQSSESPQSSENSEYSDYSEYSEYSDNSDNSTPSAPPARPWRAGFRKKGPATTSPATASSSAAPRLDRRWWDRYGRLVKWVLAALVAVVLVFTLCKRCTEIGSSAASEVYVPSEDKGFVRKSNLLLQHLVDQGKDCPKELSNPKSVEDLMKRYPALVFALPYGESDVDGARAADLRLVGIRPEKITDEDDRRFYYNSDIPSLLERQRASLGDRLFRIRFADSDTLSIRSIEVVAAMFKLALVKDPWVGTVTCADNALFPTADHCFVVWGKSVMPLRQSGKGHLATDGGHEVMVRADDKTHSLRPDGSKTTDFLRLYQDYEAGNTTMCVKFADKQSALYLDYLEGGKLRMKTSGCHVTAYDEKGAMPRQKSSSSAMNGEVYDLKGNVKLMVTRISDGGKIAELMVTRQNPMLTLSSLIHSNAGKARYNIAPSLTDRFSQQILGGLSTTLRNSVYRDTVHLSIDPMLSMVMEKELENYANQLKKRFNAKDQWELSFTVMDMATGCVVAAPFYRSADKNLDGQLALGRKNPALMRRYVGSSFKPLVALAAVLTQPGLVNLSTGADDYRLDGNKAMFLGHTTTAWANDASASGFWSGCPSMSHFLAVSDDVYPVALVAKALNYGSKTGSPFSFGKKKQEVYVGNNDNFTWANAPFVRKLDYLYTLPDMRAYNEHDSLQMAYYTWNNLGLEGVEHFGLDNITPDPTLLYFDNFTRPGATMKQELVPWVLGQGTNEWNCLKLAEAWTRMLTKRRVEASLVAPRQWTPAPSLVTDSAANNTWNAFLKALLAAQHESPRLLTPMQRVVDELNGSQKITDKLLLFSKTGTPDNYTRMEQKRIDGRLTKLDVGIYCMAFMPESAYRKVLRGEGGSGLMCVMRVTRVMANNREKGNGIQSSDARNFFSQNPDRLRKFYQLAKPYLK